MEKRLETVECEIGDLKSLLITHIENDPKQLDAIRETIVLTVNGKIITLGEDVSKLHDILVKQNEKTDTTAQQLIVHLEKEGEFQKEIRAHMEEVKPYLQGVQGFRMFRSFLMWVAGGLVAWAAIKNNFKL